MPRMMRRTYNLLIRPDNRREKVMKCDKNAKSRSSKYVWSSMDWQELALAINGLMWA